MHLVVISAFQYPDGGPAAARHLALASGLLAAGHEVSIILLNQAELSHHADIAGSINWTSVASGAQSPLIWRFAAVKRLGQALDDVSSGVPIDVVLLTGLDPILLQGGLSMAKRRGLPVVHELTEYPDVVGSGGVFDRLARKLFERRFMPTFDGMLVISRALDEYVRHWTTSPVQIVGAMVDTTIHQPLPALSMSTTMVVGYAGSLSQAKDGVLTLLDAVAKTVPLLAPDMAIRVEVLGDKDSLHGKLAVERVHQLGIQDLVRFHGLVPHTEVRDRLQDCHVLVLPRPDSKQARGGFPTKLGEYLSTARPVMTTAVGDIPLYLQDDENCVMVQPDADEIAGGLVKIARNYPRAQGIGAEGRRLVEDSFDAAVQSRKVALFAERLASSRRRTT